LLIQGCDRNSWIWPYWYEYFRRAWDFSCGVDVVMICETIAPHFDGVKHFQTTGSWSARQRAFVIEHPEVQYIIYAVEDQLLMAPVALANIKKLIQKMRAQQVKFILLQDDKYMHSQVVRNDRRDDGELIRISYDHKMVIWLQSALIETRFYHDILTPGMTAWDAETAAHDRVRKMGVKTYMYIDRPLIRFREVLRRGKLKPHRMKYLWAVDADEMFPAGDSELDKHETQWYYDKWREKIKPKTVLPGWVK